MEHFKEIEDWHRIITDLNSPFMRLLQIEGLFLSKKLILINDEDPKVAKQRSEFNTIPGGKDLIARWRDATDVQYLYGMRSNEDS